MRTSFFKVLLWSLLVGGVSLWVWFPWGPEPRTSDALRWYGNQQRRLDAGDRNALLEVGRLATGQPPTHDNRKRFARLLVDEFVCGRDGGSLDRFVLDEERDWIPGAFDVLLPLLHDARFDASVKKFVLEVPVGELMCQEQRIRGTPY